MSKIAIILGSNTHWAPYYSRYVQILSDIGKSFDFIIWNREGITESMPPTICKLIEFKVKDKTNDGSIFKVFKFLKFASFVKKVLSKSKYDRVIFLGTYAFVPAVLNVFLKKHYKGRYWVDLRDLTYEHYYWYFKKEKAVIENSFTTVISSKGFLPYLPPYNYGFIHNIDSNLESFANIYKKTNSPKIRIGYIGNISYYDSCISLIKALANDNRFLISIIGPNSEPLRLFCKENGIANVRFHGRFQREETVSFYNDTDIVYNIYGNDSLNVKTALSNKLYYSLRFKLPILVSKNTYMEELCSGYNFSMTFEPSSSFADSLFLWYSQFDSTRANFDGLWAKASKEDEKSIELFKSFIG